MSCTYLHAVLLALWRSLSSAKRTHVRTQASADMRQEGPKAPRPTIFLACPILPEREKDTASRRTRGNGAAGQLPGNLRPRGDKEKPKVERELGRKKEQPL